MLAKFQKLACVCTVAGSFDLHMRAGEHIRQTRDAGQELELGLPQYTCGVATGIVAV